MPHKYSEHYLPVRELVASYWSKLFLDFKEWLKPVENDSNKAYYQITKINNSLMPPHFIGDVGSIRRTQDCVKKVLDQIGEMSAQEQKLNRLITSAEKLRTADGHTIYIIKDADANGGKGDAVGMLKVGKKHLFLYDEGQTVHEVEPLCVLDFFVKQSHQRRGLGKKLFEFMLQDQHTTAERLAVDGPSVNMRSFLAKNYHLTKLIKQPNNFAVSQQFFADLPATTSSRPGTLPFMAGSPAGRFTARHPRSTIREILHGNADGQSLGQDGEKYQLASSGAPTPAPSLSPSPSPLGAGDAWAAAELATGGGDAWAATELATGGGGAGEPQRPSSLAVGPAPPGAHLSTPATPVDTPLRRNSQLTDKGFFDIKFHHKKLW